MWGFIAQQLNTVLDHTIKFSESFIPNVYKECTVTNDIIFLDTTDLHAEHILKLKIDKKDRLVSIVEIIDSSSIRIDAEFDFTSVFVYGIKVSDEHSINTNAVFAVSTAALNRLDTIVSEQDTRIHQLEKQYEYLIKSLTLT